MNLKDKMNKDMNDNRELVNASDSTDWLKLKEGKNIIHVVGEPEFLSDKFGVGIVYPGCGYRGTARYLAYVVSDEVVKKWKMPMIVYEQLAELQENTRANFDGFPMPYKLEVSVKNAGTKDVKYIVMAGGDASVTDDLARKLAELESMPKVIKAMQDAQKKKVDAGEIKIPEADNGPGYAESLSQVESSEEPKQELPF